MRRPNIPPFDTYREYFTKNWLEWFDSLDNEIKQTRLLLHSYIAHAGGGGVTDHNDLIGIQGGTTNEYYHLTSANYTEATAFLNGGSATHTQLDNEKTSSISHRADSLIHFEQADIDHTAINTGGSIYTHPDIDNHIDDISNPHQVTANQVLPDQTGNAGKILETDGTDVSWVPVSGGSLEYDEIDYSYTSGFETEQVYSLVGFPVKTIETTYNSLQRPETITNGTDTWTLSYGTTGQLINAVKS